SIAVSAGRGIIAAVGRTEAEARDEKALAAHAMRHNQLALYNCFASHSDCCQTFRTLGSVNFINLPIVCITIVDVDTDALELPGKPWACHATTAISAHLSRSDLTGQYPIGHVGSNGYRQPHVRHGAPVRVRDADGVRPGGQERQFRRSGRDALV